MPITVIEHSTASIFKHLEDPALTVDFSAAPNGHNFIQFTNLGSSRAIGTIDGTAPTSIPTSNGSSLINGFIIPDSGVNGGVRYVRYNNADFSSLKLLAASGVNITIEVSKVGATLISK